MVRGGSRAWPWVNKLWSIFQIKTTNITVILRYVLKIRSNSEKNDGCGANRGLAPPKSVTDGDVKNFAFRASIGSEFYKFVSICSLHPAADSQRRKNIFDNKNKYFNHCSFHTMSKRLRESNLSSKLDDP